MAKVSRAEGIARGSAIGAGIGAVQGLATTDMAQNATVRPDGLFGNAGEVIAGSMGPMEGIAHIATSTGYGALGAAALVGGAHLGMMAVDRLRNHNKTQFKKYQ